MNLFINKNMATETMPDKIGEMNHEAAIIKIFVHFITLRPLETIAMPIVAPTILCVPDTGKPHNVAIKSQIQQPSNALI
jgi:hypothetical protein